MAAFTTDELTTPITREQFSAAMYDALATVGVSTATWRPGAVTRSLIAVSAVIFAALSALIANVAKGGFLQLASGLWLRAKALLDYGEEWQAATIATGVVLVSNSSGGHYELDPDDLEVSASVRGRSYKNTAPVTLRAGALNVPVAVRAVESGSASSALPGEIDTVITALPGLSVRNTAALIGLDGESEQQLRTRCTEKVGSFSPLGPSDAYTYAVASAKRADGSRIGATRTRTQRDLKGGLRVVCATASGALSADDVAHVNAALKRYAEPTGVDAVAESAEAVIVPIEYEVWHADAPFTDTEIATAISDALKAYFAAVPVGGVQLEGHEPRIFAADITNEIARARKGGEPLNIFRVQLTAPAADVKLGVTQVAVLGGVSGAINRVKQDARAA